MTRRAWAIALTALLILSAGVLLAMHWDHPETVQYLQGSQKPVVSVPPYTWPSGTVNVNTADEDALQSLNGINAGQIRALLADREINGPFDYPEDLIYVKGIGEKTLAKIYDQLDFTWRTITP